MLRCWRFIAAIIPLFALLHTSCASNPVVASVAFPFLIKSDEQKLRKTPGDEALRVEAGSYYIMYANAFLEGPAMMLPTAQFDRKEKMLNKAKTYYQRGVAILREGLDRKYPGINAAKVDGTLKTFLVRLGKDDVPALYWTVAGTMAAYSLDPFDIRLGIQIPELSALIKRAYEIDPDFDNGAIDSFFISFYGALPKALGGDAAKAKTFFKSAVEKSGGNAAGPYLSYVTAIAIPEQDKAAFKHYLDKALNVDYRKMRRAEEKLANTIAQNKARYYLKNEDRFILPESPEDLNGSS